MGYINRKDGEKDMGLLTAGELIRYIDENDTGLAEADFTSVDIDDFIKSRGWTQDNLRNFNIGAALEAYKKRVEITKLTEIMARDIRSVDSTDEEYEAFLQMYFNEVDKECRLAGTTGGIDIYTIVSDNVRYFLYFGKTKNMDDYNIREDFTDGVCRICLPMNGMIMSKPFCYSSNDKFFLFVETGKSDSFSHWLSETFVKTG